MKVWADGGGSGPAEGRGRSPGEGGHEGRAARRRRRVLLGSGEDESRVCQAALVSSERFAWRESFVGSLEKEPKFHIHFKPSSSLSMDPFVLILCCGLLEHTHTHTHRTGAGSRAGGTL